MNVSLQKTLNRWILTATAVFAIVTGIISGWVAFNEAKELQDLHLMQIAQLVATRTPEITLPADSDPEDALMIQRLGVPTPSGFFIPNTLADGFHTLDLQGESWRVVVYTAEKGVMKGQRLAVSQRTQARDEITWGYSLGSFLPLLLLGPILMAVVSFTVNQSFKPVRLLTQTLDQHNQTRMDALPVQSVPLEFLPFVTSLNHLFVRLEQAITQQRRFVADAAHELRTPVAALTLQADNLGNVSSLDEAKQRVIPLQQSLERMRALVVQLLDLARLHGETADVAERVDFQHVLQTVIADLYPLAESRSIDLGILRSRSLNVMDIGNNLSMLIRNAIENAIHYTPIGGKVDVSLYEENAQVVFLVEDTGCGIPEPELTKVFEPFFRGKDRTEPGNGLGLSISQEIAQRLGGDITLSNLTNSGLAFRYSQAMAA